MTGRSERGEPDEDLELEAVTTMHARNAVHGDPDSIAWIVARFSPLLLAQADYRLPRGLRPFCDPEDLVNDVWFIVLQKIPDLIPRDGRFTPVVLKFLSSVLTRRLQTLLKKHILGKPVRISNDDAHRSDRPATVDGLPQLTRGVVTRVVHREEEQAVTARLEELEPDDREIIVLRGIEQNSTHAVATMLGLSEGAVRVRYHRAVRRLRDRLPGSIFAGLPDD
jgi:RNA polymerase sigma-70 factor (ECF subfamily)